MREITEIIIHCSATAEGRNVTVEDIDRWHKERGFKCIGYHYVIYLDGSVHEGRPESEMGAHCSLHNAKSIGVCYIGGTKRVGNKYIAKDTRTDAQKEALRKLIIDLKKRYPKATVHGHREFAAKECPCFDVQKEFSEEALLNEIESC